MKLKELNRLIKIKKKTQKIEKMCYIELLNCIMRYQKYILIKSTKLKYDQKKKVKKSKPKYVSIKTYKYKGWFSENGDENEDKKSLMYQPYHHQHVMKMYKKNRNQNLNSTQTINQTSVLLEQIKAGNS